ncbi:unnamed protein product [Rotaria sp. Silwood1]|nr:unnamed protein product [Rotaria sp. Silwood1]
MNAFPNQLRDRQQSPDISSLDSPPISKQSNSLRTRSLSTSDQSSDREQSSDIPHGSSPPISRRLNLVRNRSPWTSEGNKNNEGVPIDHSSKAGITYPRNRSQSTIATTSATDSSADFPPISRRKVSSSSTSEDDDERPAGAQRRKRRSPLACNSPRRNKLLTTPSAITKRSLSIRKDIIDKYEQIVSRPVSALTGRTSL